VNEEKEAVAFAQLYPATCSLAMKHFYWLYDLFVDPSVEKLGMRSDGARSSGEHGARRGSSPDQPGYGKDQSEVRRSYTSSQGYEVEGEFLTYHFML
jgi:hypothetical protein